MFLNKLVSKLSVFRGVANGCYTFISPQNYLYARKHAHLYDEITAFYIDGIFLVWLLKKMTGIKVKRTSFDFGSIAHEFFLQLEREAYRLAIFGGSEADAISFKKLMETRYPNISLSIIHDGYSWNDEEIIRAVESSHSEVVLLGLGFPRQDVVASKLAKRKLCKTIITCGAFISQSRHGATYYPAIINRLNLRWAFRLITEPRVIVRMTIVYPRFAFHFIGDALLSRIKVKKC